MKKSVTIKPVDAGGLRVIHTYKYQPHVPDDETAINEEVSSLIDSLETLDHYLIVERRVTDIENVTHIVMRYLPDNGRGVPSPGPDPTYAYLGYRGREDTISTYAHGLRSLRSIDVTGQKSKRVTLTFGDNRRGHFRRVRVGNLLPNKTFLTADKNQTRRWIQVIEDYLNLKGTSRHAITDKYEAWHIAEAWGIPSKMYDPAYEERLLRRQRDHIETILKRIFPNIED